MNLYLEPPGFLGTGASLLADITLIAYILLLVPGMIVGFVYARRGKHRPEHKWLMIGITGINWVLILALMIVAYNFDIAANFRNQPGNTRYLLPTLHALLGAPAQLLATYVVYRMLREDISVAAAQKRGEKNLQRYWFKNAKITMRITLGLWLATAALGIVTYLVRYNVLSTAADGAGIAPIVTPEATEAADGAAPETTPEAAPAETPEALPEALPQVTPEVTPDV
jgi:uncharacterized membrane protein YozB (DUF420 family)